MFLKNDVTAVHSAGIKKTMIPKFDHEQPPTPEPGAFEISDTNSNKMIEKKKKEKRVCSSTSNFSIEKLEKSTQICIILLLNNILSR